MRIQLREFQRKAVGKALRWLRDGQSVCLVSPTGSGKTVMAHAIAAQYPSTLCVVHTRALLKQAQQRLGRAHTIQQLLRCGTPAGMRDPDLVIWDECHHSASDEWSKLAQMFPRARLLGLTATPQRGDGRALDAFDRMVVAAQYSELIAMGALVSCRVFVPDKKVDGSDPDPVNAYRRYAKGTRVLFFVRSIEQADAVATRLGQGFAAWHHGIAWGKRAKALAAFGDRKLRGLVTVEALTEGFDVPSVETIVLGRACEQVGTFLQIVGRGLRAAPGKSDLLLLDLSGASLRHGSPVADRVYTIDGSGISDVILRDAQREPAEPETRSEYSARLIEVFDWSRATAAQKEKYQADLHRLARARGFEPAAAEEAVRTIFG
jgi:DNA repair protein RadD